MARIFSILLITIALGASACNGGSALEVHATVIDATSSSDSVATNDDTFTPVEDVGPTQVVATAPLGVSAVAATSTNYRMVSTLGPAVAHGAGSTSASYALPGESR
ncbi:MAG: hypothetical protein KC635_04290 [Myxococcales bacterium]|nr:hypothetical protein [Myxococcales bacterium]MCB9735155.1 hypothetical protein [Deltaproteobacteria bacterium]